MPKTHHENTMCYLNSRVFNSEDFIVKEEDFRQLDAPRPFGLSGHLRVRNEAMTLRPCLDSCLPFLDELIITYNDSNDTTEEILLEYARRFPHKIRLFWYPLEWGAIRGTTQARPFGHLAQFYNFGYTKVRYKYYMKIDGDQIYFPDKMLFIKKMLQKYSNPTLSASDIPMVPHKQSTIYEFCERNIARALVGDKSYTLVLGGINICYCKNELYITSHGNLDGKTLFNGFIGDTFIIAPSFKQRYFLQGDFMEVFPHINSQCIPLGIAWVHAHLAKQNHHYQEGPVIPLRKAHTYSWDEAYKKINTKPTVHIKTHNTYKNLGRQFWDRDVPTFLTENFYQTFFTDILSSTRKRFNSM